MASLTVCTKYSQRDTASTLPARNKIQYDVLGDPRNSKRVLVSLGESWEEKTRNFSSTAQEGRPETTRARLGETENKSGVPTWRIRRSDIVTRKRPPGGNFGGLRRRSAPFGESTASHMPIPDTLRINEDRKIDVSLADYSEGGPGREPRARLQIILPGYASKWKLQFLEAEASTYVMP